MNGRITAHYVYLAPSPHMIVAAVVGLSTAGAIWFGITFNQTLAIALSLVCLTIWVRDRLSGLIASTIFFMSKSFWVRLSFAIEGPGFDLLGITPALLLAGLIVYQMIIDSSTGTRPCSNRIHRLMAAFAAISLTTIVYSGSPIVGLGGFERNVLPNMMILFLAGSVIADKTGALRLLKALMVFGLISTIYAIGQYALGLYPWEQAWFRTLAVEDGLSGWLTIGLRGIEFRIFSLYYGYMDFFFSNLLIFTLATACRSEWTGAWRRINGLYAASWIVILTLSLERMPIVMTLVVFLALKYMRSSNDGRRRIAVASFATGVTLYGILLWGGPALKSTGAEKLIRLAELANPFQATSILDRTETKWLPAIETIASNPWGVGIGYGSQTKARASADASGNYIQPHNELVQKTLETGVVGGLIYLLLLLAIFRDNLILFRNKDMMTIGAGLVAVTLAFWICGMVNLPFSGSSGLLYWLWAGIAPGMKYAAFPNENSIKTKWENADTSVERSVQDETTTPTTGGGRR